MKTRKSSYCLRAEAQVKDVLRENLRPVSDNKTKPVVAPWRWLSSSVTSLISARLGLDPTWLGIERWLDNIEFSSIKSETPDAIQVTGALWCGDANNIGGAQWPETIEAEFALTGPELDPQLTYSIKLWADGMCRIITPSAISRVLETKTDLNELIEALNSKNATAPQKSPIIHVGLAALVEDITYVTAYSLACAGPDGRAALAKAISEGDQKVRETAIYALGLAGPASRQAVFAISDALGDKDQQTRCLAAVALWRIAGDKKKHSRLIEEAIPHLLEALKEDSYQERFLFRDASKMATRALAHIALSNKSVIALVIARLQDERMRWQATEVLFGIGPDAGEAVPTLIESLKDEKNDWRNRAVFTLWRLGPRGRQAVIELLRSDDIALREKAVLVIEDSSAESRDAIPALIETLKQNTGRLRLRCHIAYALAKIDLENEAALKILKAVIPGMVRDLKSGDSLASRYAAGALSLMGAHASEAASGLIEILKDRSLDNYVRGLIIKALGDIGANGAEAIPLLCELAGESPELVFDAAIALSKFAEPEASEKAISILIEILKSPERDHGNSYQAFQILEQIGPPAVPALARLIASEDSGHRQLALSALGEIGPLGLPAIIEALSNVRAGVRSVAAKSLIKIGREAAPAIPALRKALDDSDLDVCAAAAQALACIGAQSVPVLIAALDNADPFTVKWAAGALKKIGTGARQAAPALAKTLSHEDAEAREMAALALEHIDIGSRPSNESSAESDC